jgi:uncharacterized membrane protein
MTWLFFAGLTAFFDSLKVVFGKHSLGTTDIYVTGWAWRFFAFLALLPALAFVPFPALSANFWWAILISGGINLLVTPLYMRAIQMDDLSLVMPMITFTPLFLLITSPIVVGEFPSWPGLMGMVLIVLGAYGLNIGEFNKGWLQPLKALVARRGPRLMLLVAFLWSISANFDKIGMQASSPLIYSIGVLAFLTVGLTPFALRQSRNPVQAVRGNYGPLMLLGISSGLVLLTQMFAMELTLVAYVIAIKRTSAALSVLWGALFFKEPNLQTRLPAVVIMLMGVILITIGEQFVY